MSSSRRRTRANSCSRSSTAARAAPNAFGSRASMAASTTGTRSPGSSMTASLDPGAEAGELALRGLERRPGIDRQRRPTKRHPARSVGPRRQWQAGHSRGDRRHVCPALLGSQHPIERRQELLKVGQDAVRGVVCQAALLRPGRAGAVRGDSSVDPGAEPLQSRDGNGLETIDAHGPQREARVLDDLGLERAEPDPMATLQMGEQRINRSPCTRLAQRSATR